MGSEFSITILKMRSYATVYQSMYPILTDYMNQIEKIKNNLEGDSYKNIKKMMGDSEESLNRDIKSLKTLEKNLNNIIDCYEKTEKDIYGNLPKGYVDALKKTFKEDLSGSLIQDFMIGKLESGINTITQIKVGAENIKYSWKQSSGENAFVILRSDVATSTREIMENIEKSAKVGSIALGGLMDFWGQLKDGEEIEHASIKTVVHVVNGAAIGSIIPVGGTVIGAAVGLVAGTVITMTTNSLFDNLYDNEFRESVDDFVDDIGDAFKGKIQNMKTIFG
ncbi:MAG: glycine zipper family protein [Lachnospiraceae bacterium]